MSAEPPLAPGEVEVSGSATGLTQEIRVGRHRLHADEPVASGGADLGPNPYELLLAALGSCTSMTVNLYAARKKLPLAAVRVRLRHYRIHAEDCANCETKEGMLDRIDLALELTGPLTEADRARLLEIANRCPVHRTLTGEIDIQSRLAAPAPAGTA